jgi:energy-coupling factor transporter ATP-binding protein EcfA2
MKELLGADFKEGEKPKERNVNSVDDVLIIKDVNLKIKKGQFVVILGDIASGKSSLFSAMIGDMLHCTPEFCKNEGKSLTQSALIDSIKHHSELQVSQDQCPVRVKSNVSYAA